MFTQLTKAHCNFSTASPYTHPSLLTFWPLAQIQHADYNQVISRYKTPLGHDEFCYNRVSCLLIITNPCYLYQPGKPNQDSKT